MSLRSLRATVCATVASLMFSALALTSPGSVLASGSTQQSPAGYTAQTEMNAEQLVEKVGPAVVTVYNLKALEGSMGQDAQEIPQGSGSGFIISDDGYIITNWHVVTGGDEYAVQLQDGTVVEAKLIGSDARDDLAVVQIDAKYVETFVTLADSDKVKPGQAVVAIGSPLGSFTNTVTAGIVSALHRDDFQGAQSNCQNYSNLIQHDAPINPGNSGGPLFNMEGEVIGVNTLGLPLSQDGTTPLQGLFFAVPSNMAKLVSDQLIKNGHISAPYIGVQVQAISAAQAQANGLDIPGGSLVLSVTDGGPADAAGLRKNDIITAIDGKELSDKQGLPNLLINYQPGDKIELTILRGNQSDTVSLTLGELPQEVLDDCTLAPEG